MSKLLKRVTAVILTAVMMMGVFGSGAFAAETASKAPSNVLTICMRCDFRVKGKEPKESLPKFKIPKDGAYQITFDGAAGSGAIVSFYKEINGIKDELVHTLTIPVYVSGMPTLSTYFDFKAGTNYMVEVKSSSKNKTTSGYFNIYGVSILKTA